MDCSASQVFPGISIAQVKSAAMAFLAQAHRGWKVLFGRDDDTSPLNDESLEQRVGWLADSEHKSLRNFTARRHDTPRKPSHHP
jgi:tRNA G18 (ribose-2'-O)-methylase SpoU